MILIRQFLDSIHRVDPPILDDYLDHWTPFEVPARTLITAEGEVEHYMLFVESGIQKSYYLDAGHEHIIAFTYPPSFSGIPDSFLSGKPSRYFLETLSASRFLRISFENHNACLAKHHALETLFRKAAEMYLTGLIERHHELMAYDIEKRFRLFMERSGGLIHSIPQKDLASYLRIDPTNFSKLINKVKV